MALGPRLALLAVLVSLASVSSSASSSLSSSSQQFHSSTERLPDAIWSNCSTEKDPVKVVNVNVFPSPPKKGDHVSIQAKLETIKVLTGGVASVSLHYGIIPIYEKQWNLCDLLKEQHRSCPLKKGPLTITFNTTVPGVFPDGHYFGRGMAMDQNSTELVCIEVEFHL